MKTAVCDIDAIIWDMSKAWKEEIDKVNSNCPYPGKSVWKFYEGYLSEPEVLSTIKEVHMKQHLFYCFDKACMLTKLLTKAGLKVIIASHRDPESRPSTERWLSENGIGYDELYTGPNKHFLLEDAAVFIDDCPESQEYALKNKVQVFSIKYPYNKHVVGVNFFDDFSELLKGVEVWLEEKILTNSTGHGN